VSTSTPSADHCQRRLRPAARLADHHSSSAMRGCFTRPCARTRGQASRPW
jgi:hypothetical protein